jgi:hypothetical protein
VTNAPAGQSPAKDQCRSISPRVILGLNNKAEDDSPGDERHGSAQKKETATRRRTTDAVGAFMFALLVS